MRDTDPPKTAFITVDGRRWRASDPGIPQRLRQELVNELMAARRAVRDARSARAIRRSRCRVNDAKLALGERGRGCVRVILRESWAVHRGERFCHSFGSARLRWLSAASLRFFVAVGLQKCIQVRKSFVTG